MKKQNLVIGFDQFAKTLDWGKEIAQTVGGKLATMPDLINLRLEENCCGQASFRWYNTATTLYIGNSGGKNLVVLAHHFGPLIDHSRVEKWVNDIKNESNSNELSYITQNEFDNLIKGRYGEVFIFDIQDINLEQYRSISKDELLNSKFFNTLFGVNLEKYLDAIEKRYLEEYNNHRKEKKEYLKMFEWNIGHRNEFSQSNVPEKPICIPLILGTQSHVNSERLTSEIQAMDDGGLSCMIIMQNDSNGIKKINFNVEKDWEKCLIETKDKVKDFYSIMESGKQYFAQYEKNGYCMDICEAKFPITSIKKVGDQTCFKTQIHNSPFLKYHIDEVKKVCPPEANSYAIVGDTYPGDWVTVPIQFYKTTVDDSKRIMKTSEVLKNKELLFQLNGIG